MTVAEAGRRGIQASIEKHGVDGHAKRCRLAVAAREFYKRYADGRERWARMSQEKREEWCEKHIEVD